MILTSLKLNINICSCCKITLVSCCCCNRSGIHKCNCENRHWFADRADVVLFEELDGKPFGMPTSLTYSADASDWVREGAAIVLECMEACRKENGLAS